MATPENLHVKTVLVTGGAGFIGSNFISHFLKQYPNYQVVNIDKLTYASDLANLAEAEKNPNYTFVKGDLCNRGLLEHVFQSCHITDVIHFAAESHVDNSITDPGIFIKSNVEGTGVLLDVARNSWFHKPFQVKEGAGNSRFLHISTDEVFGSLGATGYFTEETAYAPNSPYSASKASSDMLVRAYNQTYGLNTLITNCSNNYGPKQHYEKLIPTIMRKALSGQPIPIYGDGKNVRDWLYVLDHCKAIDQVFHAGKVGETYCIGGNNELMNIDIAKTICSLLDELKPLSGKRYGELITYVTDRPGHDRRYAIDFSKIKQQLGWMPEESFESGIRKTVEWYLNQNALQPDTARVLMTAL
jgi:dTDP-glucose 4,6-dehydratase